MQKLLSLLLILASLNLGAQSVKDFNVTWTTPSENSAGSMPIGNGEVGANVWVEPNGDLLFYISRTDAWSETSELFKLGRVRVSITPSLTSGNDFVQILDLGKGKIRISGGGTSLDFFIDSDADVIYLTGKAGKPVDVKVTSEIWRDKEFEITPEMASGHLHRGIAGFAEGQAHFKEYPDYIASGANDITVYHHNCESQYETILQLENLQPENRTAHDPLTNRAFGYRVKMNDAEKLSDLELLTKGVKKIDIKISTLSGIFPDRKNWESEIGKISDGAVAAKAAGRRTARWWKQFWNRSYIYIQTPDVTTGEKISSTYALQRWVEACGGRGNFPIKFNGSIFNVDPQYILSKYTTEGPDFREWGGEYWWQNTRLPYHPLLKSGDFDLMKPLFEHYFRNLDMMKANAKAICGAEGALSPETQTTFGTFCGNDYRWDRVAFPGTQAGNPYIKYHWDSSVEMVVLMLDYWDYTGDKEFVKNRIIPYANEMLKFYDSFYKRNENGKLEITPTQALETFWDDVVNDTPTVAGLWESVSRLQKLPSELTSEEDMAFWKRLEDCLPEIPTGVVNGKEVYLPAREYDPTMHNGESPELYTVFPFHFCNISTDNLQMGLNSFDIRYKRGPGCWGYDGQLATRLGVTDVAKKELLEKIEMVQEGFRFPVMWGHMDWVPDGCHGGNIMLIIQDMCLQTYDGVDYLLPAFPENWGVKFKLHSFGGKIVKYTKKLQ